MKKIKIIIVLLALGAFVFGVFYTLNSKPSIVSDSELFVPNTEDNPQNLY